MNLVFDKFWAMGFIGLECQYFAELPQINRQMLGAEEISTEEGDQLELNCRADRGWPRPKFHWYFNDQRVGPLPDRMPPAIHFPFPRNRTD